MLLTATGNSRWAAWWVAVVVAVHFVSLAWIFAGWSLVLLAGVELILLGVLAIVMHGVGYPTSRWVGPTMAASILLYGVINGAVTLIRNSAD